MPIKDNRKEAVDKVREKIAAGKQLTADEVKKFLYLARDYALLYVAQDSLTGVLVEKARVRLYNSLQNAVERYELIHGTDEKRGPITIGYEFELPATKNSDVEA